MRWLLEFWKTDPPPPVSAIPRLVFKAMLFGALLAPLVSIIFDLATTRPWFGIWEYLPQLVWHSMQMGAIFSTSFYLTCGIPPAYVRPLLKEYPVSMARTINALMGAVGGGMGFALAFWGVSQIEDVQLVGRGFVGLVVFIDAVIGAILAVVIGAFARLKDHVKEAQATTLRHELQSRALSEAAARAQAAALQAQINPHFFFNALNTTSALIHLDPRAAEEMLGRLGDMFRYTMTCSQQPSVTLDEELKFVENYLALEQARFTNRLKVELPRGDFGKVCLPGLSLQPLVENAVRHGIARIIEGGAVEVSVERNGASCTVTVKNPYDASEGPVNASGFFQEGHALANVRERLRLFAGERARIEVREAAPGCVSVSLNLPAESA